MSGTGSTSGSGSGSGSGRGTKARAARARQTAPPTRPDATTEPTPTSTGSAPSTAARPPRTPSRSSRRPAGEGATPAPPEGDQLAVLAEERDFLLASLRDLEAEHDVGDVDDTDYEALKDDYTARAARVLRAIEGQRTPAASPAPARSWTRRLAVAAGVVIFAVGAGVLVAHWSGDRGAGDSITGGIRGDTRDELLEARQDGSEQKYLDAIKVYDKVLQQDPVNTEALAYKGWMLRLVSVQASGAQQAQLQAEAKASLEQALRTDANDPTSLVFMAVLLGDLGQPQAALADLDRVPPSQLPSFMASTVGQFRSQLEAQLHPTTTAP